LTEREPEWNSGVQKHGPEWNSGVQKTWAGMEFRRTKNMGRNGIPAYKKRGPEFHSGSQGEK
jgi:hypothetical protein